MYALEYEASSRAIDFHCPRVDCGNVTKVVVYICLGSMSFVVGLGLDITYGFGMLRRGSI